MEETKNLNEVDEALSDVDPAEMSQEDLKEKIGDFLTKERGNAMILGYRVCCQTVLQKIAPWRKPKCSHRDYERIFKDIEKFCSTALEHDESGTEETVQN